MPDHLVSMMLLASTVLGFCFQITPAERGQHIHGYAGFEAESEEEVTVSPGDEIIVHIEVDGWYQITRVADQTRGLVPASYVQVTA